MATQRQFLTKPYGAYYNPVLPGEDAAATHVEKGSIGGEYLRRFWQPVAMTSELGELPIKVRMFGEDLILFRTTAGDYGLLDLHCSHRGTLARIRIAHRLRNPLLLSRLAVRNRWPHPRNARRPSRQHVEGSALPRGLSREAVPGSRFSVTSAHPNKIPEFPIYDSYEHPGDKLVPYSLTYPCNWLQVQENVMDPAHAVFLHTRVTFSHFADVWGELPVMEFVETPTGMIYITTRRWNDKVWVRSNDIILPNLAQVGHIWEDGQEGKQFCRVGITRWTTPVDNKTCKIIGWRHFHPDVNPRGIGKEEECGLEKVDFYGQTGEQRYEDRQRLPGDFDAQVSQRPIAIHALEHLTYCDKGVVMLRRLLRREMQKMAADEPLHVSQVKSGTHTPTYCHDTVLAIPMLPDVDDRKILADIGRKVTEIVVQGDYQAAPDREQRVRALMRDYERSFAAQAAE